MHPGRHGTGWDEACSACAAAAHRSGQSIYRVHRRAQNSAEHISPSPLCADHGRAYIERSRRAQIRAEHISSASPRADLVPFLLIHDFRYKTQCYFLPAFLRDLNFTWISTDFLYYVHENVNSEYKNCSITLLQFFLSCRLLYSKAGELPHFTKKCAEKSAEHADKSTPALYVSKIMK